MRLCSSLSIVALLLAGCVQQTALRAPTTFIPFEAIDKALPSLALSPSYSASRYCPYHLYSPLPPIRFTSLLLSLPRLLHSFTFRTSIYTPSNPHVFTRTTLPARTDEHDVIDYWESLVPHLTGRVDVLNSFILEAKAIKNSKQNRWLTYGLPLHRMRGSILLFKLFISTVGAYVLARLCECVCMRL